MKMNHRLRPKSASDQEVEKIDPHFFKERVRVCFLGRINPRHSLTSNHDPSCHDYFPYNYFRPFLLGHASIFNLSTFNLVLKLKCQFVSYYVSLYM